VLICKVKIKSTAEKKQKNLWETNYLHGTPATRTIREMIMY